MLEFLGGLVVGFVAGWFVRKNNPKGFNVDDL